MDVSTMGEVSRASSWSSVAVVGGGVGGAFTMIIRRGALFIPIGRS